MVLSIDWPTKVINVPKSDLTLIQTDPTEIRQLDLDSFRLELKSIEASEEGHPFIDTHNHNPPVSVGGVTLARVIEIINGYTVTFEDGQYAVNLSGANSNISDVTNVNQVSVRSANSAGLTDVAIQRKLDYSSVVWLTQDSNSSAGTSHPLGTSGNPVNNINDALTIVANNGLTTIHALGTWNFDSSHDISSLYVEGSRISSNILLDSNVNTTGTIFTNVNISGNMNGPVMLNACSLRDIKSFSGNAISCGLMGVVEFDSGSNETIFVDCYSSIAGDSSPEINLGNNSTTRLSLRRYCGGLKLSNMLIPDDIVTVEFLAGKLRILPTCTNGYISGRGLIKIYDSSSSGCIVDTSASVSTLTGDSATISDISSLEVKLDQIIEDALTKRDFLALS